MDSPLYSGEFVIDDSTPESAFAIPSGFGTGLDFSTRTAEGYGAAAEPFPDSLLIPESEWQARIQEMEQQKSRLSDIINQAKLPPKNQQQTSYCWGNAVTHSLEIRRVVQNEPMVILSPASVCAQIKNYRNVGGWDKEAVEWLSTKGAVPVDKWPANGIDRQYATPENKALALHYRIEKWITTDNSIQQIVSLLLRRIPVCVGLDWWGHEVTYVDAVWIDGAIAVRPRNSWGDIPDKYPNGYFILQGRKMIPSSTVAPYFAHAA